MKTTVDAIKEKINGLPADYVGHVTITAPGKAEVVSFSDPSKTYYVEIKKEGDGLSANCSCPATKLCKHVAAYYAVAKKIKPVPPIEMKKKRDKKGYDLIAEAIEKLTDGIALIVKERMNDK